MLANTGKTRVWPPAFVTDTDVSRLPAGACPPSVTDSAAVQTPAPALTGGATVTVRNEGADAVFMPFKATAADADSVTVRVTLWPAVVVPSRMLGDAARNAPSTSPASGGRTVPRRAAASGEAGSAFVVSANVPRRGAEARAVRQGQPPHLHDGNGGGASRRRTGRRHGLRRQRH